MAIVTGRGPSWRHMVRGRGCGHICLVAAIARSGRGDVRVFGIRVALRTGEA